MKVQYMWLVKNLLRNTICPISVKKKMRANIDQEINPLPNRAQNTYPGGAQLAIIMLSFVFPRPITTHAHEHSTKHTIPSLPSGKHTTALPQQHQHFPLHAIFIPPGGLRR